MGVFKDKVRKMRLDAAQRRKLDEILHEVVDEEMTAGEIRRGLWTKALAETEGDETRTKARYISLRVQSLTDEMLVMDDALRAAKETLGKYRTAEAEPQLKPGRQQRTTAKDGIGTDISEAKHELKMGCLMSFIIVLFVLLLLSFIGIQ